MDNSFTNKKKIIFVTTSLNVGGIATAIKNLINALPTNLFDITLLLFKEGGEECLKCNFKYAGKIMRLTAINQKESFKENTFLGIYRLLLGFIARFFGHGLSYRFMLNHSKMIKDEFDVAISYTQSGPKKSLYGGCNEYVLKKINSKLKIAFLHCDYKLYGLDSHYSHTIYKKFDRIAAVSESVKKRFIECEPSFSEKTLVSSNFHNYESIEKMANDNPVIYQKDHLNILTVARFGKEKGHMRMLHIFKNIKEQGYEFLWHLVGANLNNSPKEFVSKIIE